MCVNIFTVKDKKYHLLKGTYYSGTVKYNFRYHCTTSCTDTVKDLHGTGSDILNSFQLFPREDG